MINRRQFGAACLAGWASRGFALPAPPKLLVLVLLEQFRSEYLPINSPLLTAGGFRRLTDRGAWFPSCRHLASTFPASTVATLGTGAWPAQHGIVADAWYDRTAKRRVSGVDEELRATTLAAQIGATDKSHIFIVSDSASRARLFAGTPQAKIIWMDETGQFASQGDQPGWLAGFNSNNSPDSLRGAKWMAVGAKQGAPPVRVLQYEEGKPGDFAAALKASPFAQTAQLELLGECIERERLGQGDSFDFAAVLVGAGARLGYETGGRHPLMQQLALQLDRNLDALFTRLTRLLGENGFTVAVAAGHGAPPQPPAESRARLEVESEAVAQHVDAALKGAGLGAVQKYIYPFLYLDTSAADDPETVRRAAADFARTHPAVADTFTAGGRCSAFNEWKRRFENSFHATRSGDVMISYRPEYVEKFGEGRGVSYGSLYDYDAETPLFFYGPQFRPGVYETPVESVDVAATLARAAGVAPPSSASGRVLGEALAE